MTSRLSSRDAFQVDWDKMPLSPEWDAFVESSEDGHHEQTSRWGQVRSAQGWNVGRLVVRESGRIVAGAQLMTRPLSRFGRWGYVTYGPIIAPDHPDLECAIFVELKLLALRLKTTFLMVGLPYGSHEEASRLPTLGFVHKPARIPPKFIQTTCVLDLTKSPEELMANMRRSTRQNVRYGLKKGIVVTEGAGDDLNVFFNLMVTLCQRRGTSPNPAQPDFFLRLWQQFAPKGWVKLFLARKDAEPVSAALAFAFGDWFRVWKVGWSGQHAKLKPNEAMWWEMIAWARQHGCRHFDFVQIDDAAATSIAAGGSTDNVTGFKLGFGGQIINLPGAYCFTPNPLARATLRCGLLKLLASPWVLRCLGTRSDHSRPIPSPEGIPRGSQDCATLPDRE